MLIAEQRRRSWRNGRDTCIGHRSPMLEVTASKPQATGVELRLGEVDGWR